MRHAFAAALLLPAFSTLPLRAQSPVQPVWDSVGTIVGTRPAPMAGYLRFNLPRADLKLHVGTVMVAPALALGAWAGFAGPASDAVMMGDLLVTPQELKPVLAELSHQGIEVQGIHNHLAGEQPEIVAIHFHAMGKAIELAGRLDHVLAHTATPRPVVVSPPEPLLIDTALVFRALGAHGRASGRVAQVSLILVPGEVVMDGHPVVPAFGYASPINVQMVDAQRAVATGDFAVLGPRVDPVLNSLATHGIVATAVHTHLVDERPEIYYIHFWADGPIGEVVTGIHAAAEAGRPR